MVEGSTSDIAAFEQEIAETEDTNITYVARELAEKEFIVFAGSGTNRNAGVPNWRSLLKALLEINPLENIDIDTASSKDFPMIAQKIFDSLEGEGGVDDYYKKIKEGIRPTDAPCSYEQIEIVTTTDWIITTNFDPTFESAFKKKFEIQGVNETVHTESLPTFSTENLFGTQSVIYLHGKADEKHIIFKTDDYKGYYPSLSSNNTYCRDVVDYLKHIFKTHTIVFIGFSFEDLYVRTAFKKIYEELKLSDMLASTKLRYLPRLKDIRHYAFLEKVDQNSSERKGAEKLDDELKAMNIKVIRYDKHIEWTKCFKEIVEIKKSKGVATHGN